MAIDLVVDMTRIFRGNPTVTEQMVRVYMQDNLGAFRRNEAQMPLEEEPYTWILGQGLTQSLWDTGSTINQAEFFAGTERQFEDYYYAQMQALYTTLLSEGGMDGVIAAGEYVISQNPMKQALFSLMKNTLLLNNPQTDADKRALIFCMMHFVSWGLLAGGIKR